jgi:NodT family efflux transporter outer membrane factor (OMF) lipoprotein
MVRTEHGKSILGGLVAVVLLAGCTSPREYIRNGLKVGPNYQPAVAHVSQHWIDANDVRIRTNPEMQCHWWTALNDPTLARLVQSAYQQNLTLREAAFRVMEARAQLAIARGEFFPQTQDATGSYRRIAAGAGAGLPPQFFNQWSYGFNLAWELDFWGRLRRAITAADANLDASVYAYDDAMVTLIGDMANSYIQVRTLHERIRVVQNNVKLQRDVMNWVARRLEAGFRQSALDLDQAKATLAQTQALLPPLYISLRQATNHISTLLGMPAQNLDALLGIGPIPYAGPEIALGIPCDLVRRRPDVRRAERLAAAQAEQIGIAEAALYPTFTLNGTLNYTATRFSDLFSANALNGSVGPSFQWSLLNYGRIINNVRLQDATFRELVVTYQQTVLRANEEVENGLITFLQAQEQAKVNSEGVQAGQEAVKIAILQFEQGAIDFNRYATIATNLVQLEDTLAQSKGLIAQGLVQTYVAVGGGWELRLQQPAMAGGPAPAPAGENMPAPPPAPTTAPAGAAPSLPGPMPNVPAGDTLPPPGGVPMPESLPQPK